MKVKTNQGQQVRCRVVLEVQWRLVSRIKKVGKRQAGPNRVGRTEREVRTTGMAGNT